MSGAPRPPRVDWPLFKPPGRGQKPDIGRGGPVPTEGRAAPLGLWQGPSDMLWEPWPWDGAALARRGHAKDMKTRCRLN